MALIIYDVLPDLKRVNSMLADYIGAGGAFHSGVVIHYPSARGPGRAARPREVAALPEGVSGGRDGGQDIGAVDSRQGGLDARMRLGGGPWEAEGPGSPVSSAPGESSTAALARGAGASSASRKR